MNEENSTFRTAAPPPAETAGRDRKGRGEVNEQRVVLDVRPVPQKDRFDRIMGGWQLLRPGQVLELIVDHDPECMYYTLKATDGDDAFRFDYLERGPVTWRVEVRKRAREALIKTT